MNIIRLLFHKSGKLLVLGAIASVFTGVSSGGLIALINYPASRSFLSISPDCIETAYGIGYRLRSE